MAFSRVESKVQQWTLNNLAIAFYDLAAAIRKLEDAENYEEFEVEIDRVYNEALTLQDVSCGRGYSLSNS